MGDGWGRHRIQLAAGCSGAERCKAEEGGGTGGHAAFRVGKSSAGSWGGTGEPWMGLCGVEARAEPTALGLACRVCLWAGAFLGGGKAKKWFLARWPCVLSDNVRVCVYGAEECLRGDLCFVLCCSSSVETVSGGDGMLNWAVSVSQLARLEIHMEIGWEHTLVSLTFAACKMVTCSGFICVSAGVR